MKLFSIDFTDNYPHHPHETKVRHQLRRNPRSCRFFSRRHHTRNPAPPNFTCHLHCFTLSKELVRELGLFFGLRCCSFALDILFSMQIFRFTIQCSDLNALLTEHYDQCDSRSSQNDANNVPAHPSRIFPLILNESIEKSRHN